MIRLTQEQGATIFRHVCHGHGEGATLARVLHLNDDTMRNILRSPGRIALPPPATVEPADLAALLYGSWHTTTCWRCRGWMESNKAHVTRCRLIDALPGEWYEEAVATCAKAWRVAVGEDAWKAAAARHGANADTFDGLDGDGWIIDQITTRYHDAWRCVHDSMLAE